MSFSAPNCPIVKGTLEYREPLESLDLRVNIWAGDSESPFPQQLPRLDEFLNGSRGRCAVYRASFQRPPNLSMVPTVPTRLTAFAQDGKLGSVGVYVGGPDRHPLQSNALCKGFSGNPNPSARASTGNPRPRRRTTRQTQRYSCSSERIRPRRRAVCDKSCRSWSPIFVVLWFDRCSHRVHNNIRGRRSTRAANEAATLSKLRTRYEAP